MDFSSYTKTNLLIQDHQQHQSALGFSNETKMGYSCKTNDYDCAYACAPHLVQLKWTHCQIIVRVIKVRWDTITIACTETEWCLIIYP